MPNSRIEAAFFVSDEIIEALGAWTTDGNNLIGGGGDLIGSIDDFGFFFLTNSVRRGGFLNTGELFLQQSQANLDHRNVWKVVRTETNDALDTNAFTFSMPSNTTYKFSASVQYRGDAGTDWGGFERKVMAHRDGGTSLTEQTFPFTEREGDSGTNARWTVSSNDVSLTLNGIAATNVVWSVIIQYQGILNI